MKPRFLLIPFTFALLLWTGCGRKEPPPPPLDAATQKQMDLLIEAIQTVESNYVDESKVVPEQLIASTIRGMIEPVDPQARVVPARRDANANPPVSMHHAGDGQIVSLKIPAFDEQSHKQLRKLESQIRRARTPGILVDLRGTTGHDYEAALVVLSWFLPPDSVAGTLEKRGAAPVVVATRKKPVVNADTALVLLVDEQTEDAAEWMAAALKYYQRAILVGRPTRGLGLIRNPVPVTGDWTILMTAGIVRTPDGTSIEGAPVQPDVLMTERVGDESIYQAGLKQLAAGPDPIIPPED